MMGTNTTSPQKITLEDELSKLQRYGGCDHEADIRADVISEVKSLLRKYSVIDASIGDSNVDSERKCSFCGSSEKVIVHRKYCICD